MAAISLELIYKEMQTIKKEVLALKKCFHEDVLDLSEQTKIDIEEARKEIKKGHFLTEEQAKKALGL